MWLVGVVLRQSSGLMKRPAAWPRGAGASARVRLRSATSAPPAAAGSGTLAPGGDVQGFLARATADALGREFGEEFGSLKFAAFGAATKKELV